MADAPELASEGVQEATAHSALGDTVAGRGQLDNPTPPTVPEAVIGYAAVKMETIVRMSVVAIDGIQPPIGHCRRVAGQIGPWIPGGFLGRGWMGWVRGSSQWWGRLVGAGWWWWLLGPWWGLGSRVVV